MSALIVPAGVELPASVSDFLAATLDGDGDAAVAAVAESFEISIPSAAPVNVAADLHAQVSAFGRRWPDGSIQIERVVGTAPHLAVAYVLRMVGAAEPVTGARVELAVTVFIRLDAAGRITSWREQFDAAVTRRAVQAAERKDA